MGVHLKIEATNPRASVLRLLESTARDNTLALFDEKSVACAALKARCTLDPRRYVSRNLHEDALRRMQQRTTVEVRRLRGSTVEHPCTTIPDFGGRFGRPRLPGAYGRHRNDEMQTVLCE